MAMTLTEAAKLSNDTLRAGVIETIVKESPILAVLPWEEVLGNSLTYNRENAAATAAFYDVGDTWAESTTTFTQVTAALKILGGDADIDNFLARTRSNIQDLTATVLELKAKAVAHAFEDTFVYGDATANPKEFNGLHNLIPSGQQIHQGSGTTPAALSLANIDSMIDLVRPGKPDFLLMSRRTRRGLSQYARATNSPFFVTIDQFGRSVATYNGIPIFVSDFQVDTEAIASGAYSAKTGGASSSVFAIKVGADSIEGIQASSGIEVEPVGHLETKDAQRFRVKWYCAVALFSTLAVAKLDGISSAAVVA